MDDFISKKNEINTTYPLIKISGGLSHLQDQIISSFKTVLPTGQVLFVILRWTSDIERFLNKVTIIDDEYTYAGVISTLEENKFKFVEKLESQGEYSRKGDVVSFWPVGYQNPIRIEFFDDEIESMYFFDPLYHSKLENADKVIISDISILDDQVEWQNIKIISSGSEKQPTKKEVNFLSSAKKYEIPKSNILLVLLSGQELDSSESAINLELEYPQLFYSRLDLFEHEVQRLKQNGYQIIIQTQHQDELPENLSGFLNNDNDLSAGFVDNKRKIVYFTDRELFGTIFITKEKQKRISSRKARKILDQIEGEVEIGDYVVHEDHGIGIYNGITREKEEDYLQIDYAEGDQLLVPLNQIHKITKYIGISNEKPQITKLDKINWQKLTAKTKKVIQILAKDLISHYAKLELAKAKKIDVEDSPEYKEFVDGFGYEETPDQKRTIKEVFEDINSEEPMNRLIVGDVGFGKTEVAMRAAFKVVHEGLQVGILAPTTVLASQHYKVFRDRMQKFGIKVAMLSRFTGRAENQKIIDELNQGKIDIVVGTHRLLSSDIKFKNLGLLIIDEEQKFGVAQKEKLKKIKYGVHILSMTATPIPRTLSMALSEIQDISIISTPPKGRQAVKTYVEKKDWDDIRNSIKKEIERGGQVYFVHNQVQTIDSIKARLQILLPDVKFVIAHGQMKGNVLEKAVNDFYEKKYDCLICTTIIENGIDMPNVNTIIIDKAQNFGLGQLYQLRGRVGRSDKQAYAYMFYDGDKEQIEDNAKPKVVKTDKDEEEVIEQEEKKYIKRLKAILESQELGSGFKIASRDLEIRGAGNLLGREQHGQISKVGLALYMQMLAEEIERQKQV